MKSQKKFKLFYLPILLIAISFALVGCIVDGPSEIKLGTPKNFTLEATNEAIVLNWTKVSNTNDYKLFIYNEAGEEVKELDVVSGEVVLFTTLLLPQGNYTAKLQAMGDGDNFLNSEKTKASKVFAIGAGFDAIILDTPSGFGFETTEDGVVFNWTNDPNATSYKLYIYNESEVEVRNLTVVEGEEIPFNDFYLIVGDYTSKLQAIGDGVEYKNSDLTNPSDTFTIIDTGYEHIKSGTLKTGQYNLVPEGKRVEVISGGDLFRIVKRPNGSDYLYTLNAGLIVFDLIEGSTKDRRVYDVVYQITSFGMGRSLTSYLNSNHLKDYLKPELTPYTIGNDNPYVLDISATYGSWDENNEIAHLSTQLKNTDLLYELKLGGVEVELEDYASIDFDHGILFNEAAIGKTFEISVMPKNDEDPEDSKFTQMVLVKEGVNVHSNLEMKDAFADLGVHDIYLHRNIVAELLEDQFYEFDDKFYPYNFTGLEVEEEAGLHGNLYRRFHPTSIGELNIHGNYFTINASDLPLYELVPGNLDPADYFPLIDRQGGEVTPGTGVVSVHSSMFRYGITTQVDDEVNYVGFNNLTIIGNTNRPDPEGRLEYSGGVMAIKTDQADLYVDNINIAYTTVGLFPVSKASDLHVDYADLRDSWAHNVLLWGNGLTVINNSVLGGSGGSSICVVDNKLAKGIENYDDLDVVINNTTITNITAGDSPWFRAYQLTAIGALVSGIEQGVLENVNLVASMMGLNINKTIIKIQENDPEASSFNFAILIQSGDAFSAQVAPQARITIDGVEVYREYTEGQIGDPYSYSNDLIKAITAQGAVCMPYGWPLAEDMLAEVMANPSYQSILASGTTQEISNLISTLYIQSIIKGIVTNNSQYLELMPDSAQAGGAKVIAIVGLYDKE